MNDVSFLSQLFSTLRSGLEGDRTIRSDDTQAAHWERWGEKWLFPSLPMRGEKDKMGKDL